MAEHRQCLGQPDPARGRHHSECLCGRGAERAGQPVSKTQRQRRHRRRPSLHAGQDLLGPEGIASGLPRYAACLRSRDEARQQTLDLPHVQRGEVYDLRSRQSGKQGPPGARRRRFAGCDRIGRCCRAGGQQQCQRSVGDPPERERQCFDAGVVQPLHVINRNEHRPSGRTGTQRSQHGKSDGVRGGRLRPGCSQQQRYLQRVQLRRRDLGGHLRQHVRQQVRQPGEGHVGLARRRLGAQHPVASFLRGPDAAPPQRRLARAGFALQRKHGRECPGTQREIAHPAPFGLAHDPAAIGSHSHISPHQSGQRRLCCCR